MMRLLLLFTVFLLTACGQKGSLYLPSPKAPEPISAPAPNHP